MRMCSVVGAALTAARMLVIAIVLLSDSPAVLAFAPASEEHDASDNFNVPCKYVDSIATADLQRYARLVGGEQQQQADLSPSNNATGQLLVGQFDYAIRDGRRRPVERHQRQCVCRQRPCIRLRCARGQTFDEDTAVCTDNVHVRDVRWDVRRADGRLQSVSLFDAFGYTVGGACERMTPLVPAEFAGDAWQLNERGEVERPTETLTQHQYSMYMTWTNATTTADGGSGGDGVVVGGGQVGIVVLMCLEYYVNLHRFEYLPYGTHVILEVFRSFSILSR